MPATHAREARCDSSSIAVRARYPELAEVRSAQESASTPLPFRRLSQIHPACHARTWLAFGDQRNASCAVPPDASEDGADRRAVEARRQGRGELRRAWMPAFLRKNARPETSDQKIVAA